MQNEAVAHILGFGRFAPVQILAMGSPVTSGNDAIDYFVSSSRMEYPFPTHFSGPLSHLSHYTEQLVMLDGLGISYPETTHRLPGNLEDFFNQQKEEEYKASPALAHKQLAADGNLEDKFWAEYIGIPKQYVAFNKYTCTQQVFKISPAMDAVVYSILRADPSSVFLLQSTGERELDAILLKRIRKKVAFEVSSGESQPSNVAESVESISTRIILLPRIPTAAYSLLLSVSTVLLHPFPFGGSKTAYDSIKAATPLVSLSTNYLSGKMAQALYYELADVNEHDVLSAFKQCCLASTVEEYTRKAVKLGTDKRYNEEIRSALRLRSHRVSSLEYVGAEWRNFLYRALAIGGRGGHETLCSHERQSWWEWIISDLQNRTASV